jgi:hypothetical protein
MVFSFSVSVPDERLARQRTAQSTTPMYVVCKHTGFPGLFTVGWKNCQHFVDDFLVQDGQHYKTCHLVTFGCRETGKTGAEHLLLPEGELPKKQAENACISFWC